MLDRFAGEEGREALVGALLQQKVLAGNQPVAEAIAEAGELVAFQPGTAIVEQNGDDNDVYFIINGVVDVLANDQRIAVREGGTVVGEMVVVDPTARRSATLVAHTEVVALKVSASGFQEAGKESCGFWRQLAQVAGDRLRERSKFHLPPNPAPILFMGSSVEGLKVAQEVQNCFKHDPFNVRLWTTNGVFGPSGIPIDDLIRQVDEADFAVFAFGPDDKISCRDAEHEAPRDNVVFEMGLFIGRLGRERVFMLQDADVDLKIPSDLSGVTPLGYKLKTGGTLAEAIGTACNELRKAINTRGVVLHRMST